jgi:hypothetical protein
MKSFARAPRPLNRYALSKTRRDNKLLSIDSKPHNSGIATKNLSRTEESLQAGPNSVSSHCVYAKSTETAKMNQARSLRQHATGRIHMAYHGCNTGESSKVAASIQSVPRRQSFRKMNVSVQTTTSKMQT